MLKSLRASLRSRLIFPAANESYSSPLSHSHADDDLVKPSGKSLSGSYGSGSATTYDDDTHKRQSIELLPSSHKLDDNAFKPVKSRRSRTMAIVDMAGRRMLYVSRIRVRINNKVSVPILLLAGPLLALLIAFIVLLIISLVRSGDNNSRGGFFSKPPPELREINGAIDKPFVVGCVEPDVTQPRANAVLVVLARNSEIEGVTESMKSLERHFNRWFHYPYVFLNDEPFNATFRDAITNLTESSVKFGTIDAAQWDFPEWASREDIEEGINRQGDAAIMYGGMESYHHMCRFYSGKFYNHPLLANYEWYWRVEPEVKYFCDITYDPFLYMAKNKKVYGFTIFIKELVETVPNLFRHTAGFKKDYGVNTTGMWDLFLVDPEADSDLAEAQKDSGSVRRRKKQKQHEEQEEKDRELEELADILPEEALLLDDNLNDHMFLNDMAEPIDPYAMNGEKYNMCHFWSNFEIARLDFFRSKQYNDYFEALDRTGGFWNERWGDAPVHSLAAGLFLEPEQVHYFRDIGYRHTTIQHCPANAPHRQRPHIPYIPDPLNREDVDEDNYWAHPDPEKLNGVGCRCRCDTDVEEVEGKDGSCLADWVEHVGGWV